MVNIPITPSVYSNRANLIEHNCFQRGNVVHVYIKAKANQSFSGNTVFTNLPAPTTAQSLFVDTSGSAAVEIQTGANGIVIYSMPNDTTFKICGSYYL